jgi:predicted Zn-dependent protease
MDRVAVEARAFATNRRKSARRALLIVLAAAAVIGGTWKLWQLRRYRQAMAEIKQEMRASRQGHAARKLAELLAWQPDSDEATYLLGVTEQARGQVQAAFAAWERVSPASPFSAPAIQGRMQLLLDRGRLADAEKLIIQAMSDRRADGSRLCPFLGLVYSMQGRVEERQRVIEASWDRLNERGEGASEQAILLLRLHIQVPPIEEVRAYLEQATRSAPDDDRAWLGKAKLAIRDGSFDEAARLLDACVRRRPDDVPVWRAKLDLGLATRRLADVREALRHVPAEDSSSTEVDRLRAWLAAFAGDIEAERRALERLITDCPNDLTALDRLVVIALKDGKADRADELRRKKLEVERLQARYAKLYRRNQTIRDSLEMASLAEQLGQPFEARVFLTIAVSTEPEEPHLRDRLHRANKKVVATQSPAGTLADRLANELDAAERATSR